MAVPGRMVLLPLICSPFFQRLVLTGIVGQTVVTNDTHWPQKFGFPLLSAGGSAA